MIKTQYLYFVILAVATAGCRTHVVTRNNIKQSNIKTTTQDRLNTKNLIQMSPEAEAITARRNAPFIAAYLLAVSSYKESSNLSIAYTKLSDYETMALDAKTQIGLSNTYKLKARILLLQGRYQQALDTWDKSWRRPEGKEMPMCPVLAICYFKLGNIEKARTGYPNRFIESKRLLKLKDLPDVSTVNGLEAALWYSVGLEEQDRNMLRSHDFYNRALALAPNCAGILYDQANAMKRLNYTKNEVNALYLRAAQYGDGVKELAEDEAYENRVYTPPIRN